MQRRYSIDPDIKKAETLPASFYRDPAVFEELKERVFAKTWQWVGDDSLLPPGNTVYPFVLLDKFLSEPMVLTRDREGVGRCLTNVCTHRGNIIVQNPGKPKTLVCGYHGRSFDLDGKFKSMPEFKTAENFPRPSDDLRPFHFAQWGPHLFVGLEPRFDVTEVFSIMNERVGFLPLHQFRRSDSLSKDYLVNCHWALYCDNYLEGFHIPFVHADLNKVVDYGQYTTVAYEHLNLQIGYADQSEVFELPAGHIDHGRHVAAYYFWLFPNMMFNFYPWGLSVNLVRPLSPNRTKVSFVSYVYDESKLGSGAGAMLDKVEREDEFVVEGVHNGLQSRYYPAGRFSPTREVGVHQFHRLLAEYLDDDPDSGAEKTSKT
ncbi:MAG: aromatic ring-hydroxylating dioxygenase subunit alpha [candidate division Zixibacteria bacterium]|nr:aromatic ring-hydroxylating dioxygenase subunit alpha [candidate division Zixibacteria bacterium]